MNIIIRDCQEDDAPACGEICFSAFKSIADNHNFPADFPSAEVATGMLSGLISHPRFYGIVAELDGNLVGSNFLDERSTIAGVGPMTVSPRVNGLHSPPNLSIEVTVKTLRAFGTVAWCYVILTALREFFYD